MHHELISVGELASRSGYCPRDVLTDTPCRCRRESRLRQGDPDIRDQGRRLEGEDQDPLYGRLTPYGRQEDLQTGSLQRPIAFDGEGEGDHGSEGSSVDRC